MDEVYFCMYVCNTAKLALSKFILHKAKLLYYAPDSYMIIACDVHEKYSDSEKQTFCNIIIVLLQLHDINGGKLATNHVVRICIFVAVPACMSIMMKCIHSFLIAKKLMVS